MNSEVDPVTEFETRRYTALEALDSALDLLQRAVVVAKAKPPSGLGADAKRRHVLVMQECEKRVEELLELRKQLPKGNKR